MGDISNEGDAKRPDEIETLAKLITGTKVCMFTTTDHDGRPLSRPMAVQEVEFDGHLWFFTKQAGRKVEHIGREPWVNVALSSRSSWVSVTGKAEVVHDVGKARELWNAGISAWFPKGPDDPELVLLKVHADGAEYWDGPGAAVITLLSLVKSRLTGEPYRIEDRKVDL